MTTQDNTTSIATQLIKGNGKFKLFEFDLNDITCVVTIKQTSSECSTGRVSVFVKCGKEKQAKIGAYSDWRSVAELKEYVQEECLELDVSAVWRDCA